MNTSSTQQGLAVEHLKVELEWLRSLLTMHLRRLQRAQVLPPPTDTFPGTAVTPEEIEARIELAESDRDPMTGVEASAAEAEARAEEARQKLARAHPELPLPTLQRVFELSAEEYLLLLLSLANDFDPGFARMFAYLQNHFERQYPTLALVLDGLAPAGPGAVQRRLLDDDATLLVNGLVRLDDSRRTVAVMHRPILAEPRIVRWVQGIRDVDPNLYPFCQLRRPQGSGPALLLTEHDRAELDRLCALVDSLRDRPWDAPVLVLRGPRGVGKHHWIQEIGRHLGHGALFCDMGSAQPHFPDVETAFRVLGREAALHEALLCLHGWEFLLESDLVPVDENMVRVTRRGREEAPSLALQRALGHFKGALAFIVEDSQVPLPSLPRELEVCDLSIPDRAVSAKLWARFLPKRARDTDADPAALAAAFRLTPGQIESAVEAATRKLRETADGPSKLSFGQLGETVKEQIRHRLGDTATLVKRGYRREHLIIPDDISYQLDELLSRYAQRARVLEEWGLGRRFGQSLGLSVLFEGPPGTGKTMAASIVAKELGLDLYQIDLSRVVSRYVGETEKNLSRIFDEAEQAQAMLLFDEADSLFATRTRVQSSNDRYANLEVNYLLQRIETFTGIAILTTNFPTALDDAFKRRLTMRISFPKPTVPERQRMWESMLPWDRVIPEGVDCEYIAEEFELTGGHIRNAVLRAAFVAAAKDCEIDEDLLRIAARIEMKEQGMLVHGSPYSELQEHTGVAQQD